MVTGTVATENSSRKLSHKAWRAEIKRKKRRIKRQQLAKQRDELLQKEQEEREKSPGYQARQAEKEREELIQQQWEEYQRERQHSLWLERERNAQAQFLANKEWKEKERQRQEEEERKIRAEWEERLKKEKELAEEKEKIEKEKKEKQDALLKEATSNENKDGEGSWHNPIAPPAYGSEREPVMCPFFAKVGACRFAERCSRAHNHPESSCTLLFPGMYHHFRLLQGLQEDNEDGDVNLEYDDKETYEHFKEFYNDVLPEFKESGKVIQFKVSCNFEPHLRGNVYVQYAREEDAVAAFMKFNGRFYGGRRLQCEFTAVTKWKPAICGLFHKGRCPKGKNCNFLHVFRNPGNEFWEADRDNEITGSERYENRFQRDRSERHSGNRRHRSRSRSRTSRYSRRSRSPRSRSNRNRERSPRSSRNRSRSRSPRKSRNRSRSPRSSRYRSRSPYRSDRRARHSDSQNNRSGSKSPSQSKRSKSRSVSKSPARGKSYEPDLKLKERSHSKSRSLSRSPHRKKVKSKKSKKKKKHKKKDKNKSSRSMAANAILQEEESNSDLSRSSSFEPSVSDKNNGDVNKEERQATQSLNIEDKMVTQEAVT